MSKIIINLEQNENINITFKKEQFKKIENLIIYSEDEKLNTKLENLYLKIINNLKENVNFKPNELDQIIGFNLYQKIKNNEIVITNSFPNFEKIMNNIENNIIENVNYFKLFLKSNNVKDKEINIEKNNVQLQIVSTKDILVDNPNVNLEFINKIREKQSKLEGSSHLIRCLNDSLKYAEQGYHNRAPERAKKEAYDKKIAQYEKMYERGDLAYGNDDYRKWSQEKLKYSIMASNSKIFWENQEKWSGKTYNDMVSEAREESRIRRSEEAYEKYQKSLPNKLDSINNSCVFNLLELASK